jgi:hypothetical protein
MKFISKALPTFILISSCLAHSIRADEGAVNPVINYDTTETAFKSGKAPSYSEILGKWKMVEVVAHYTFDITNIMGLAGLMNGDKGKPCHNFIDGGSNLIVKPVGCSFPEGLKNSDGSFYNVLNFSNTKKISTDTEALLPAVKIQGRNDKYNRPVYGYLNPRLVTESTEGIQFIQLNGNALSAKILDTSTCKIASVNQIICQYVHQYTMYWDETFSKVLNDQKEISGYITYLRFQAE